MAKITKTLGPIHFEDLEPHRFEDLVRQLIYDFRDWQNIEATGRSGSDDGFDVRAWEKVYTSENQEEGEEEDNQKDRFLSGNLWMIQCKREKEIGPSQVLKIIEESINKENLPYGYILVASTNFSKTAYDKFSESLRKKGVQEFYLWSKASLEDMLYMPKNDRILFSFFGISLITRRRSKRTEIRFIVNNKNKLFRIFGDAQNNRDFFRSFLARDIKDLHYPWQKEYKDFDEFPRWREYIAYQYHPLGLLCKVHEYYAYIDQDKKQCDFIRKVDLLSRQGDSQGRYQRESIDFDKKVADFWEHLPYKNKAKLTVEGLIEFESMEVIDEKGDSQYDFPHIYVDFKGKNGPFAGFWNYLIINNQQIDFQKERYKHIVFFAKEFPLINRGVVHKDKIIELSMRIAQRIKNDYMKDLLAVDDRYDFLNQRDQVAYVEKEHNKERKSIEVLYKYKTSVKEYCEKYDEHYRDQIKKDIEEESGKKVQEKDILTVLEVKYTYNWELENVQGNGLNK
jgi:predicted Zn-dependent protease with MMP-like domain